MKRMGMFLLMLGLLVATALFGWSQTAEPIASGLSPKLPTGAVELLVNVVSSIGIPFFLMLINQRHWPERAKTNISWGFVFVWSAILTGLNAQYSFHWLSGGSFWENAGNVALWFGVNFGTILTGAKSIYDGWYKPSGIANRVSSLTDKKELTDAEKIAKVADKVSDFAELFQSIQGLGLLKASKPLDPASNAAIAQRFEAQPPASPLTPSRSNDPYATPLQPFADVEQTGPSTSAVGLKDAEIAAYLEATRGGN